VGTPHYMSPEQVQGQAVDGRSDQFSLAVIAFEMLTGDKPHTGEQLTTVVYKIVAEAPISPRRLNATLSPSIEAVLLKGLAKKPEARYATCQEMVGGLEKACAASLGWKPMARGGASNEPTAMVGPAQGPKMPPARHPRSDDTTIAAGRPAKAKSGFWSFLGAVLVAAVLLGLIGWQADPALPQKVGGFAQRVQVALGLAPAPEPSAPPATPSEPPAQPAAGPVAAPASPGDAKPSPMPPPAQDEAPKADAAQPAPDAETPATQTPAPVAQTAPEKPAAAAPPPRLPAHPAGPQPVAIGSSPAGATATLDGHRDMACTTPCTVRAASGHHTLSVVMPGYQIEHLDVDVGSVPMELPPIVLRAIAGTLMVTTTPEGATVDVNGHRMTQITPATIPLSAGSYRVTVEKDGKQATSSVDIRNGAISYLKIALP